MACNRRFHFLANILRCHRGLLCEAAIAGRAEALTTRSSPASHLTPGLSTTAIRTLIRPADSGGSLPRDKFPPNYQFDDGGFASPHGPSATEMVWPMSRRQHKFSARLLNALESVIESDFHMVELCRSTGFTILEVRPSPDLRKAYVKWDAYPQRMKAAEAGLARRMNRLRAMTSRKLGSKFMPWLDFRLDNPTEEQVETEEALRQVESEMAAEGGGWHQHGGWSGDGHTSSDSDEHWEELIEEPERMRVGEEAAMSAEDGTDGAISEEEGEGKDEDGSGSEEAAKIWDLIEEMAARGATEEEIRAEVQREVRKALTGEDFIDRSSPMP